MPPVEIDPERLVLALMVFAVAALAGWQGVWALRWRRQAWIEAESYRQLVAVLNERLIVGGLKHITVRFADDSLPEGERSLAQVRRGPA